MAEGARQGACKAPCGCVCMRGGRSVGAGGCSHGGGKAPGGEGSPFAVVVRRRRMGSGGGGSRGLLSWRRERARRGGEASYGVCAAEEDG